MTTVMTQTLMTVFNKTAKLNYCYLFNKLLVHIENLLCVLQLNCHVVTIFILLILTHILIINEKHENLVLLMLTLTDPEQIFELLALHCTAARGI